MRHGWVFIDEFFIQHHFQRYTSNKYHHPGPIYYFLLVIIAGSLPWSLFLIRCIGRIIKQKLIFKLDLQDAKQRLLLLAGIWLFVPLLFFSFSGSKLPGYILPVFPALGLIIAAEVENLLTEFKEQNRWVFATALLLFIVAIALPYFMARDYKIDRHTQLILAIVPMAMAITLTLANYYRKSALIFASLSLTSPLLAITIATLLFPVLENKNSLATLSHKAANLLQRHEKIVFFHYLDYSPLFYTNGRVLEDATGEVVQTYHTDELVKLLHNHTSLLCLIKERNLAQITNDTRMQHTTLAKQRDIILLRVSLSPL
jgi:4-amino-4-deoxy-L-arabinose transferase-like glycosyltransferase